MTLNLIAKMSRAARINLRLRLKPSNNVRTLQIPPKTCLPCVPIDIGHKFGKNDFKVTIQKCEIHVTSPKCAMPFVFVLLVRTIAKLGTIISARRVRKWWRSLTPEEKEVVLDKIRSRKSGIALVGACFFGTIMLYYYSHLVEDPITKRKRFIILNPKQIQKLAEFEYNRQRQMYLPFLIPSYHPLHRRVTRVTNNLLLANRDLQELREKVWSVTVVDRPDITNAFVLPHGKIFVFTGMLNACTNDDQLAIVLAHEISHSLLNHVPEIISKVFFVDFLLLIPSVIFWSVFSDAWALFSEWITNRLSQILITLPFSRSIEMEADIVGLQLAAKACYDVREAPVFWGKMNLINEDSAVEWLSTHPRHETRQQELIELLPKALEIRNTNKCPPLGYKYWLEQFKDSVTFRS